MRLLILFGFLLTILLASPSRGDEAAVKAMVNDYARAFNDKDLEAVIGFWTEGGIHVDRETGERTEGREAVKADIAASFEQNPGARIAGRIDRVHLVKADVANVDGEVTISIPGQQPTQTLFSAILVSNDGKWMIDTIEESPVPVPESSYDALRDLEWMIGRWADDGGDTRVDSEIRWSPNEAFLLRSFVVSNAEEVIREGTEVIGWDPRSGEIRSWSFLSDGSFGDATWSKNGNDWMVQSSQTLADGQAASGTFIYSPISDDEFSVRLIGHEIEGEPQPATAAVTIRRASVEEPVEAPATDVPSTTEQPATSSPSANTTPNNQ